MLMRMKIALSIFSIFFCLLTINAEAITFDNDINKISIVDNSGQNPNNIPFKILKKPYAWDIESVTYIGRKNSGYNIRIKGAGSRDNKGGVQVNVGYYMKNGKEDFTGAYYFPAVEKGGPFSLEIVVFLPDGLTPATIEGFLFTNGFDYIEEPLDEVADETDPSNKDYEEDSGKPFLTNLIKSEVPRHVPVGQAFKITFRVYAPHESADLEIPSGLELIYGPAKSSGTIVQKVENTRATVEYSQYDYILSAENTGDYYIPPFVVELEGGSFIKSPENVISAKEITKTGAEVALEEKQDTPFDTFFNGSKAAGTIDDAEKPQSEGLVWPSYPGGQAALSAFISRNLKYPVIASEAGVQGTVKVGFTVCYDGKIKDIKVIDGVDRYLDNEAVRLVTMFPDWIPGTLNGEPASVDLVLPVAFNMN